MKKILLISSLYPADDIQFKNNTAVCHYFAKEWLTMGYAVRVINLYNEYPAYYYPVLRLAKNIFADRFGIAILDKRMHEEHTYELDGIKITRLPAFKSKPHGDFSDRVIAKLSQRIDSILQREGFKPDFILGHFILPSIKVVAALKEKYPEAITTIALHGKENKLNSSVQYCLPSIDYVGYRSYPIKSSFEQLYGQRQSFMCMSGVPEDFIIDKAKSFSKGIHKFIYIGSFMKRKYPSYIISAVIANYAQKDFTITYVGDGNGIVEIKKEAIVNDVEDTVLFTGRIARDEIKAKLDEADVFIMISENETFGLVWLEAMARGCITVASRNEGMDGIIQDGENGFLCNPGDKQELTAVVGKIKTMDSNALRSMSQRAIETARQMTDCQMAYEYIKEISK